MLTSILLKTDVNKLVLLPLHFLLTSVLHKTNVNLAILKPLFVVVKVKVHIRFSNIIIVLVQKIIKSCRLKTRSSKWMKKVKLIAENIKQLYWSWNYNIWNKNVMSRCHIYKSISLRKAKPLHLQHGTHHMLAHLKQNDI